MTTIRRHFAHPASAICLLLAACGGCRQEDTTIRAYKAPKEPDQQLARSDDLTLKPVRANGPLAWDLPDGWIQIDNPNSMRFATLKTGEGPEDLILSVSHLRGDGGGLMPNVNRWRGQIGLAPATAKDNSKTLLPFEGSGFRGLLVDIVGPAEGAEDDAQRMFVAIVPTEQRTWYIKTTNTSARIKQHLAALTAFSKTLRFESGPPPPEPPAVLPPMTTEKPPASAPAPAKTEGESWTVPASWARMPQPAPMSVVSFKTLGGEQEALITMTPLPGGPQLLSNVNRWRRQVGVAPAGSEADAGIVAMDIGGYSSHLVDIPGADSHILGLITGVGSQTWFIKMRGPDPLVTEQKEAFVSFCKSIRFATLGEGS